MRRGTLPEIGWWLADLLSYVLKNAVALLALAIFAMIVVSGGDLLSLFLKGPSEALELFTKTYPDPATLTPEQAEV